MPMLIWSSKCMHIFVFYLQLNICTVNEIDVKEVEDLKKIKPIIKLN